MSKLRRTKGIKLKVSEKEVKASIEKYLTYLENLGTVAWWSRHNSGIIFTGKRAIRLGKKGDPDLIGLLKDGRFFAFESKGSDGKITPEQAETILKIRNTGAGNIAMVVYGVEEVAKALA